MLKRTPGKSIESDVVALCGEKGCCPEADFSYKGNVLIKDDIGGRAKLTLEQLEDLIEIAPAIIRRLRGSK